MYGGHKSQEAETDAQSHLTGASLLSNNFIFVCSQLRNPLVQPKLLCFPDPELCKEISMLCRQWKLEKAKSRQRQQQQPSNQKLVQTNVGFLIFYSFPFAGTVSPSRNPFPSPLLCSIPVAGTWQPGVPWACCRPGKWIKPAGSDQNSKSIFICSSCTDQKINYSCSQICSLQLCGKDDTKETSWCKIPIILPVPLALLFPRSLLRVSDVICNMLLSKLLLCFFLRNVFLLPDDCSSIMGVLKGFWWSVQRWAIATIISEKTRITKSPFSLGEEKATPPVVAPSPLTWLCQNRVGYWATEVCFCPWPPQSSCARE